MIASWSFPILLKLTYVDVFWYAFHFLYQFSNGYIYPNDFCFVYTMKYLLNAQVSGIFTPSTVYVES